MKPNSLRSEQQNVSEKEYQKPKKVKRAHKKFLTKVGKQLQGLQQKEGINTSELCRRVGISRYSYHLMVKGEVYWNSYTLMNLLTYFKQDALKFFNSL